MTHGMAFAIGVDVIEPNRGTYLLGHCARLAFVASLFAAASTPALAEGLGLDPVLFGDARLRYEIASEEASAQTSNGLTQSLRLGLETPFLSRFSALIEGEAVFAIVDDFDDGGGNNPGQPIILDPNSLELNRAQITARLAKDAFFTLGRQRLAIDDQRFIGTFAFRQNDQTLDAAHFSWRSAGGSTFQGGYINRVNRALGADNPNGRFRGDSYYFNANIQTPIGRIGAFHYALDLETGLEGSLNSFNSSQTSGARFDGRWHRGGKGLDVEASFARQKDFAQNPFDYRADYWLVGAKAFAGPVKAGFRAETLGAGGAQSFQTPIATLHKFQGDADIFLITPPDGVRDLEVSAQWDIGDLGFFKGIRANASYHWFDADRGSADYGTETDVSLRARVQTFGVAVEYANYQADTFATDTERVFFTVSRRF